MLHVAVAKAAAGSEGDNAVYKFDAQLRQGQQAEAYLDSVFSRWFHIIRVDASKQRIGIDRVWRGRKRGQRLTVEYKCDKTAASTGNAFIELQSTDRSQGWALTSQAQYIAYYVPDQHIYLVGTKPLRTMLREWILKYPTRQIHNNGYVGSGLLVPLSELARISYIMEVDDGNRVRNGRGVGVPQASPGVATAAGD